MPVMTEDQEILKAPEDETPEEETSEPEEKPEEEQPDEEEVDRLLLEVVKYAEKEDEQLRYRLIQFWKRNTYYFNNIQKIFFDHTARDYRTIDSAVAELEKYGPVDDIKTVNVYRAFAESMIAALSVTVPAVEFFPDDAEDPDDIETSEAYSKISDLIDKHCQSGLLLIKGLTTLFNQGVICGYNYYKTDPSYGTYETPKATKQSPIPVSDVRCPVCSELLDSNIPTDMTTGLNVSCPVCKYQGQPKVFAREAFQEEVVEWEDTPKGRVGIDIFGPTYVKIPLYARNQGSCGYLILRLEDHIAKFKTVYNEKADELVAGGGDTYRYERWGRIPPEYYGTIPTDLTTARYAWIRPWFYNVLQAEDAEKLSELYPNGVMVTVIGDVIVEKKHEKLDDRWTITYDPRSEFLHAEPAGNALIPLQDAKNDIFNLGVQSIEYGIPETFVHPKTLNLQKYSQSPSTPGMMSPAMPPGPDRSLADGFHTIKTATLSNEYTEFDKSLDALSQFVTGAFPSIYGGSQPTGSKTAAEYNQSRAQALQRLQIVWKMVGDFWSKVKAKATKDFADNLREDERYTVKEKGTFINIWIKKSSLQGSVGHIEPEINDQLPLSWAQKRDFFVNLIQMKDPTISAILMHPNNTEFVKEVSGITDIYIPGENDRNKQFAEYYQLSQGSAQGQTSSVPIDVVVDDHPVHMQVLKNILVSAGGLLLHQTNPAGYENCIAHYREHEMAQQAKSIAPSGTTQQNEPAQSVANTVQG